MNSQAVPDATSMEQSHKPRRFRVSNDEQLFRMGGTTAGGALLGGWLAATLMPVSMPIMAAVGGSAGLALSWYNSHKGRKR